jgi:hypothetical protein
VQEDRRLTITDVAMKEDRRLTIFFDQRSRMTREIAIRDFSRQSSDLYTCESRNAEISPRVSGWTVQMMSGFRDFTSRDFSCALQTTKRRAPSC